MATNEQRIYFRLNVGDTGATQVFADYEIDSIYDTLILTYPNIPPHILGYQAVVAGLRMLMINATKLVSYKQNQTSENSSDIFKALRELYDIWMKKIKDAEDELQGAGVTLVMWMRPTGYTTTKYNRDLSRNKWRKPYA